MNTRVCFALVSALVVVLTGVSQASVRLLESNEERALIAIELEEPSITTIPVGDRVYYRLSLPDHGHLEEPGLPEVPVGGTRIALPPGTRASLRVVSQEWSDRRNGAIVPTPERYGVRDPNSVNRVVEETPVEAAAYRRLASYPAQTFELSDVMAIRAQRVVELNYYPVRAEGGSHRVLRRAVVEVRFESDPRRAAVVSSAPAPRDEWWERTYRSSILNANDARTWSRGGIADGATVGNAPWGGGTQWKVETGDTGIVEITYAALSAVGFPVDVAIDQVSVYQRRFDLDRVDDPAATASDLFVEEALPGLMRDRNSDGLFNGLDGIVIHTRSFRDEYFTSGYENEDKYEDTNFAWVRIDPAGGARMATSRAGGSLSGNPGDPLASTPHTIHVEEDNRYYDRPPDHGEGAFDFESEIYYWNGPTSLTTPDAVVYPGYMITRDFEAIDALPGAAAELTARVVPGGGSLVVHRRFTSELLHRINGTDVGGRTFYNANLYVGDFSPAANSLRSYTIPAGEIVAGTNTYEFTGWSYIGNSTAVNNNETRFFFDWFAVTYQRQLIARNGFLNLDTSSGAAGNVLVNVSGFDGTDVLLFDVTDPEVPTRVDVLGSQVTGGGGAFTLAFDHDNAAGTGRYVAVREASIFEVESESITSVDPPSILAGGMGARWLAVVGDGLEAPVQDLADYRSDRYTTQVSRVSEIYNVFHNGMKHPLAIKAYMTYAYHRWSDPVGFLTLVGDANEDHRRVGVFADVDVLPSHSLYARWEGAPEDTDQYYGELTRPAPGGAWDDLVDVYIGRFPVDNVEQMAMNVEKIRNYENEDLDGSWRQRVILSADDFFSGDLGGGLSAYRAVAAEGQFEQISETLRSDLENHPFDTLVPIPVYLSTIAHPCPDSCYTRQSHCQDCENTLGRDCGAFYDCRVPGGPNCTTGNFSQEFLCMRTAVRQGIHPVLKDEIADGVLIWNYQGHANKWQLAHEEVFKSRPANNLFDVRDGIRNPGRPFIFLGFACHLSEFDRSDELAEEDAMAELMMNLIVPDEPQPGGAIAVFASSGFEFLSPNLPFNQYIMDSFFYPERLADDTFPPGVNLPTGQGDGDVYRWTFGEATTRARLRFQSGTPSTQTRQAAQRYVVFGDPALEPRSGVPTIAATVDGVEVDDPSAMFFLDAEDNPDPITVTFRATDGRGVSSLRVRDNGTLVDPSNYSVVDEEESVDGVFRQKTLTYQFALRPGAVYDVEFEAIDSLDRVTRFVIRANGTVLVFDEEPALYPNPFRDQMTLVYRLRAQVDEVRASVYTVTGRKIRELDDGPRDANIQNRLEWDGLDSNGNPVANGTYLVRFRVKNDEGSLERIIPAVKMR